MPPALLRCEARAWTIRRLQQPWEWRAEPCNATCTHRQGSRLAQPGGWEGPLLGRIPYDRKNLRGRVALSTVLLRESEPRHPQEARLSIAYSITACPLTVTVACRQGRSEE